MTAFFEHFRFAHPGWLLFLLPAVLLMVLRRGRGADAAVVFPNLALLVSLGKPARVTVLSLGFPLALAALILTILATARPVWRNQYQSRTASGIDIVIAFDVSLSMDIDDFGPRNRPIRRLEAAKAVVDNFISQRPDDRIGLIAFAGRPRDASPITLDHNWLRRALADLRLNDEQNLGTVREQGTAIGSALAASARRLDARDAKSKIIILVTDGANNSGKISPIEAAEHAATLGIRIYTVAIGTVEGRVSRGIQRFPRQEFDLPTLKRIAELTDAEHYWAQTLEDLDRTFDTINQLEKTEATSYTVIDDTELYTSFAAAALACALAAALILALTPPPRSP
jgi:Ca-activated chloride channel family protein